MRKPQTLIFSPAFGLLLAAMGTCWAGGCLASSARHQHKVADANSPDVVLKLLTHSTAELKSYQCRIEYLFSQPLFESQTLRVGHLYYQKSGRKSKLRINFQTLKQDGEDQQEYIEHYIFDGVWLTHINYQIKQVKRYQQAEPSQPKDAFELVSENFPIIGFSNVEDMNKDFEITVISGLPTPGPDGGFMLDSDIPGSYHLHLKVKPDSVYKQDYTTIDLWIDKLLGLPSRILVVSTQGDIQEIQLLKPAINKKIDKKVFEFKIPKGFSKEIIPLKRKD